MNNQVDSVSSEETLNGLAIDSNFNLYISGFTRSNLNDTNSSGDIFISKLASDTGKIQWVNHIGDSFNVGNINALDPLDLVKNTSGGDICLKITPVSDGLVCLGSSSSGTFSNLTSTTGGYFLMKFDFSGAIKWITEFNDQFRGDSDLSGKDPNNQVDTVSFSSIDTLTSDQSGNLFI